MRKYLSFSSFFLFAILFAQRNNIYLNPASDFPKSYVKTSVWYDGSIMDDSKVDATIYTKRNGIYYVLDDYRIGNSLNASIFGVKADGVTDDTKSLQKALELCSKYGITLILPYGVIITSSGLSINTANSINRKIRIIGSGISNTIIRNTGLKTKTALTVTGNYYDNFEMRDFRLERPDSGYANGGTGLKVEKLVYSSLENIDLFRFDVGLVLNDVSTLYMKNVNARWGKEGMVFMMEEGGMSNPNLIEMHSCVINSNDGWGLTIVNGHSVNIYSSLFEDNKLGGINFLYNGTNGANSINLQGSYFEGNSGTDFYLKSTGSGSHNLTGNSFNRVSKEKFTVNNIVFDFQNSDNKTNVVNMIGNGIFNAGNYEISKNRAAVKVLSPNSKVKIFDTNLYSNDFDIPNYSGKNIQMINNK